jgi:hypothetical protein
MNDAHIKSLATGEKTMKRIFIFTICIFLSFASSSQACQDELPEGYVNLSPVVKYGDDVSFFIGRKKLADKYRSVKSQLLRYDKSSKFVEPCVAQSEFDEIFVGRYSVLESCFVVSPDGKYLAIGKFTFTAGLVNIDIILCDLQSRTLRPLVVDGMHNEHYFFSPDGKHILYYAHPPEAYLATANWVDGKAKSYSVRLVDVVSGSIRIVKPVPPGKTGLFQSRRIVSWAPDSKSVIFENLIPEPERKFELVLYELNSEKTRNVLTHSSSFLMASFLAQGRIIVAHSKKILLSDEASGNIRELVSADDKTIYNAKLIGDQVSYVIGSSQTDSVARTMKVPLKTPFYEN